MTLSIPQRFVDCATADVGEKHFFGTQGEFEQWEVSVKLLSSVRLFVTPWTIAHQAPPSMEFSRQEYWSGLPFPSPGDLSNPGIEPGSPALQADTLPSEPPGFNLRKGREKKGQGSKQLGGTNRKQTAM